LVFDKIISYSDLANLSYIDALKLSAIADFRKHLEKEQFEKEKNELENLRNKNGH
jgi:hypothetical protein